MNAVLKYPGAKNRIAKRICEYIPEHNVYLEPYAGSLAVFFNKRASKIETLNDLDGDIVNYFRVIRDKLEEFKRAIEMTPFAREEYANAYIYSNSDSDIERARKFAVKCWMGFGCGNLYRNGFKSGQQSNSPNPASAWDALPITLAEASKRLKNAQIENLPALELLSRYDTEDVFVYLDPPYLPDTRKKYLYKYEMNKGEHIELLEVIKNHPGKILISGYDNDLYNQMLPEWNKASINTLVEGGVHRKETLWMNYEMGQIKLSLN